MKRQHAGCKGGSCPRWTRSLTPFTYRRFVEHVLTGQSGKEEVRRAIEQSPVLRAGTIDIAHAIGMLMPDPVIDKLAKEALTHHARVHARAVRMRARVRRYRTIVRGIAAACRRAEDGLRFGWRRVNWGVGQGVLIAACLAVGWQLRGAFAIAVPPELEGGSVPEAWSASAGALEGPSASVGVASADAVPPERWGPGPFDGDSTLREGHESDSRGETVLYGSGGTGPLVSAVTPDSIWDLEPPQAPAIAGLHGSEATRSAGILNPDRLLCGVALAALERGEGESVIPAERDLFRRARESLVTGVTDRVSQAIATALVEEQCDSMRGVWIPFGNGEFVCILVRGDEIVGRTVLSEDDIARDGVMSALMYLFDAGEHDLRASGQALVRQVPRDDFNRAWCELEFQDVRATGSEPVLTLCAG